MKMTKVFFALAVTALFSLNVFAGKGKPATLAVDAAKSSVAWLGKKVTGQHNGTVNVAKGSLVVNAGKLTGGSFDIDMKSIKCTDITDAGYNGKLIGHFQSDDFFSTEKFPVSTLTITKVVAKGGNNYEVTGNLNIKGITNAITFPATVETTKTGATASAHIEIDRTKFDIKYGSKSFFASIGDKAIDDTFTLDVKLVAGK
jgi:polyisoprenoid-binding protein YceI